MGLPALPMTVRDIIRNDAARLTPSERKLANAIVADYPFGGLRTIQELAERTGVSAPSITRFISKIGFGGYQDFQRQLINELKEGSRSPLDLKPAERVGGAGEFLGAYARRAAARVSEMAESVSQEQFDLVCGLVADPGRNIFLLGGRVSDSVASFLSVHLKQIRPKVRHLSGDPELWPDDILHMRRQDVLILFDFRRYQPELMRLAGQVARRHTKIVLVTDQWMSPIARHSSAAIALPIEIGTAWDTVVCAIALVEALIVKVSEITWPDTRARIEAWDELRPARPIASEDTQ